VEQEVSNMEISGTWGRVFEVDALATQLQFIGGEERAAANAMNQSSGMLVFLSTIANCDALAQQHINESS